MGGWVGVGGGLKHDRWQGENRKEEIGVTSGKMAMGKEGSSRNKAGPAA